MRYAFRERQIYLRSEGEVQFITLRPKAQVISLVVILAGLFWLAFASINVAFKDQLLALKERSMYQARLDYEDRVARLRGSIDKLNARLMIDQNSYLDKVDEVRDDYDQLVARHQQLLEFFQQGWMPSKTPDDGSVLESAPTRHATHSDGLGSGKGGLNNWTLRQTYAREFRTEDEAEEPLMHVRALFGEFDQMQITLLDGVVDHSKQRLARAREVFSGLDMNPGRIAKSSRHSPGPAIGGPFLKVTARDVGSVDLAERINASLSNMIVAEKLVYEAGRLPLSTPMPRSQISSRFGIRRDPFRRTAAMHQGVDFRGKYKTPVRATAPGVVTKAGWKGAYGRLVQIRHDNGVSTRYAHLSSTKVKVGQKVERGQVVGTLGSTGRSTGPHLHYETRLNGRALNPTRFWKANDALQKLDSKKR